MTVGQLDDFLARSAVPALKTAGFRRRRRHFVLPGPGGFLGAVAFYPNALTASMGFFVQYGVVTPGVLAMNRDSGLPTSSWVTPSNALLMAQVFAPVWQRDQFDAYRWAFGDAAANSRLASDLQLALRDEAIRNLHEWFDPVTLAAAIHEQTPGRFPRGHRLSAEALALMEAETSAALDAKLAELGPADPVREWIVGHLADKQT